jgi:hypothetical protein
LRKSNNTALILEDKREVAMKRTLFAVVTMFIILLQQGAVEVEEVVVAVHPF